MRAKTLKRTMLINFSVIGITILALSAIVSLSLGQIKSNESYIAAQNALVNNLNSAKSAHYKWSNGLNMAINYGTEFTGSMDPATCDFGKLIYGTELQPDAEFQDFVAKIEPVHNAIHSSAEKILAQAKTDKAAAEAIYLNETQPNIEQLIALLDEIISQKSAVAAQAQQKMSSIILISYLVCTGSIVIILFACLSTYSFLHKEVVVNIAQMEKHLHQLSEGNLHFEIAERCKTKEMHAICQSLRFSVQELGRYVDAIDFGMAQFSAGNFTCTCPIEFKGDFAPIQKFISNFQEKMRTTLLDLGASASQVNAGAAQVSIGAQTLAQGATEQASSVQQLSATIVEVSKKITQTAEYSETANSLGTETGAVVEKSQAEMQQMVQAIQDIAAASKDIQLIIQAIDDIAFQTNILALNAAVEASRAGAAGKGFAVVADEVRNLAKKSAEAAKNTAQLIENSLQHVTRGESLAQSTKDGFEEVARHADHIVDMVNKIAEASREQALSISQISQGIEQISSVVQMNSATSEESAAASEELSGQAHIMLASIEQFQLQAKKDSAAVTRARKLNPGCTCDNSAEEVSPVSDKY